MIPFGNNKIYLDGNGNLYRVDGDKGLVEIHGLEGYMQSFPNQPFIPTLYGVGVDQIKELINSGALNKFIPCKLLPYQELEGVGFPRLDGSVSHSDTFLVFGSHVAVSAPSFALDAEIYGVADAVKRLEGYITAGAPGAISNVLR